MLKFSEKDIYLAILEGLISEFFWLIERQLDNSDGASSDSLLYVAPPLWISSRGQCLVRPLFILRL